jgi:hypothetical protein
MGLDGGCAPFSRSNGVIIWLMLGQGVHIVFLKPHFRILGIATESHVDMAQHLINENYKLKIHLLF